MKKIFQQRRGFTLVELLVAIAIFSVLVAIGVGGFVNALRTQRQVASLIAAQSNASIVLEQMTREIRTGYLFCHDAGSKVPNATCFPSCIVNSVSNTWTCNGLLNFDNADGQNVNYLLNPLDGSLDRSADGLAGSITGGNVKVNYLTFTLFGNTEGDQWPPRITISMGVSASSTDATVSDDIIHLQTTVSARVMDCDPSLPVKC